MAHIRDNAGRPLVGEAKGGKGATYYITTDGAGVISCTCMAWRFAKNAIENRTCKHIQNALLGQGLASITPADVRADLNTRLPKITANDNEPVRRFKVRKDGES